MRWRPPAHASGCGRGQHVVIPDSFSRDQGKHPLQVLRQGHQVPLAPHLVEPAQQKLTEAKDRLDDAEHRFDGVLALGVQLPALQRLQPVRLDRGRIAVGAAAKCSVRPGCSRPSAISGSMPATPQTSTLAALK
jgi:hypothetical protein